MDEPETNRKFAESLELDYPILSDPKGDAARAYGVVGGMQPWPSRWTFYIDRDGKILAIDYNVTPATAAEQVVANLERLKAPRRSARAR